MEYDDALRFADNIVVPRSVCATMGWGQELVHATLEFAARLKELDLDKVEFVLMNAIVLTYPGNVHLFWVFCQLQLHFGHIHVFSQPD